MVKLLDDTWIKNFEKTDNLYKNFYKEDLYFINVKILYLNSDKEIIHLKQETFFMTTPNIINKDQILAILTSNIVYNEKKFKLLSILKYNFTLDVEDVKYYLTQKNTTDNNYIESINYIDDIKFNSTISMFHDLNDLIILFYDKNVSNHNKSKKMISTPQHSKSIRKSLRKRYKD
jgi:hypothetical protein